MDVTTALLILCLLQLKHLFADYFLQTPLMLSQRAKYVHPGRALHCIVHIIGSGVVFFLASVPLGLAVVVLVLEWVTHYHIDFAKGVWSERAAHTPTDAGYWRAFGTDQFLHMVTYVVMVWAII